MSFQSIQGSEKFQEVYDYVASRASHLLFTHQGKNCGIDPFNLNEFDVWYGEEAVVLTGVEQVFNTPFFDGKTLTEIFEEVEDWDY